MTEMTLTDFGALRLVEKELLYKVDSLSEPVYFHAFPIDAVPTIPTNR
jgi:hypothetical protein